MNKRLKNSVLCLLFAICLLFSYCQNTYAAGSVAKVYYFTVGENCLGPGTSSYIVSKLSGMEYSASRYANSSKSTILSAFGNSPEKRMTIISTVAIATVFTESILSLSASKAI